MKKSITVLFAILLWLAVRSQNSPPIIANLTALADTIFHELVIRFDVSDAENEDMEILLSASADGGTCFNLNTDDAQGDVGFPITPGTGKQIIWRYPDTLSSMISQFVIKIAADDHAVDIGQIISRIDTNHLKQNLQFIEGRRHHVSGAVHKQEVSDSLFARFQRSGLHTRLHEFPFSTFTGKNVTGRKSGLVSNTKTFILDGHYDTVINSPGADDNGSAIAAILEAVRVMAPFDFAYTVEFIAFDMEESNLAGSKAFVSQGILPDEVIAGVINMDMIGYFSNAPNSQTLPAGFELLFPDLYAQLVDNDFRGNFIISTADANSNPLLILFNAMAARYVPSLLVGSVSLPEGIVIDDARRSDHASFWDAGYKALHLSDGAETRNPNYHSNTDVASTLNYAFMSEVAKAATATLLSLTKPLHAAIETQQVQADPFSGLLQPDAGSCRILLLSNPDCRSFIVSIRPCPEELTIRIISMNGKILRQQPVQAGSETEITLSNDAGTGIYFVEIRGLHTACGKKIFVK